MLTWSAFPNISPPIEHRPNARDTGLTETEIFSSWKVKITFQKLAAYGWEKRGKIMDSEIWYCWIVTLFMLVVYKLFSPLLILKNYFYSNRTNTVFEQPKQIMTLPISWYTNIRIFYDGFGPKAFEGRHIRIFSKLVCNFSF